MCSLLTLNKDKILVADSANGLVVSLQGNPNFFLGKSTCHEVEIDINFDTSTDICKERTQSPPIYFDPSTVEAHATIDEKVVQG